MGARVATTETWMLTPVEGWDFDQVREVELPFDWELVDGVIAPRGRVALWHNHVRGGLAGVLSTTETGAYRVVSGQAVVVGARNVVRPHLIVFDLRGLDPFAIECVPVERLALVVEIVSPTSRQDDRVRKPALFAAHKVPYYWRVELDRDQKLAVHEYWLNADTLAYFPAPSHPVHHDKLVTELPFPVEVDLEALVGF
ncbi:Uma2 family endonuclease [Streptomyces griseorubiginosus]|uniref:Uma2 family endonuclease n=1 Tax=Streptomyces griseorubiginosus TaxID=67304 RepID=UPI002E81BCD1|nr:Uma2 family endonuclease [Streptomyces griseorubiginosus]WUB43674.1 Uma2 family endonuclease [Streptomyces griseorubiginosus]WUB52192.1 Uma2 family endonuclease [Streptomyces griseorubiginosus]